ncbi:MAG TPA: hypothetical protein PLA24_10925 [Tenuifilaceae bacterium]|nr:hypothetical protein [Tenuifilaceae bacterium]HRX32439.1 hypothetical protein [Tenuifilaceae bacterium]
MTKRISIFAIYLSIFLPVISFAESNKLDSLAQRRYATLIYAVPKKQFTLFVRENAYAKLQLCCSKATFVVVCGLEPSRSLASSPQANRNLSKRSQETTLSMVPRSA